MRWQASPWSIYQSVAANDRVSDEAIRLVAELYFEMGKPTGGTFLTSLGDLAATQQMSALKAAEALAALDSAGWLTWDGQRQQAKLEAAPRGNPRPENEPDRRSTSKPAEMPAAYRREVSS